MSQSSIIKYMKHKTAAILVTVPFVWWVVIFVDQLNRELSCGAEDEFCNSGNTVGGDFTWSLVLWGFSMALITPVVVAAVVIWQMVQKRRKKSK